MNNALLEHDRIIEANRVAQARLAQSYGWRTTPAVEVPPPAWEAACESEEARHGKRLWKYFG